MPAPRRRSPQWVRDLDQRALHGIAMRLHHDRTSADLSDKQEWLWDSIVSELEYRRRNPSHEWWWCACSLCIPPFED